jgi:hypothetical protein
MSRNNISREFVVDKLRDVLYYVVEPQYELCSRCNIYGHSRESTSCYMYLTEREYCHPTLKRKCSRCNQPGHSRSNHACSLYQRYPDKYAPEIRAIITNNNLFPDDTVQMNKIEIIIGYSKVLESACRHINISLSHNPLYAEQSGNVITRCSNIRNDILTFIPLFNTVNVRDLLRTRATYQLLTEHIRVFRNSILPILPVGLFNMITIQYPAIVGNHTVKKYPKINIIKSTVIDLTETTNECSICFEEYNLENTCRTNCNHMFCVNCIQTYHKTLHNKTYMPCPMCRTSIVNVSSSSNVIKF